ncbi:MAG: hypothetical protein ACRC67_26885 [Inquilinus sp.]|uniref:hypothetical protein n=1 Tax=Inquilinus sp. TaxID=1932117 RepID=UPI003F3BA8E9
MTLSGDQEFDLRYLREVVDPSLAGLPTYALRDQVDVAFGDGFAEAMDADLEGVFDGIGRAFSSAARDVGQFAQRAAPAVAHIGGGIVQGAMSGSAAGLPGIIAGAAVGGAGAGLSRYGSGAARQVGQALSGVTQLAGQFSPMGRAGGAIGSAVSGLGSLAGGRGRPNFGQIAGQVGQVAASALGGRIGGGAMSQVAGMLRSPQAAGVLGQLFGGGNGAGQLMSALQRPETQQALAALRLGPMGRSNIPVGPQQVPVPAAAFAQLLGHLAQQAAGAGPTPRGEADGEAMAFMEDGEGGFFGDPASPGDRAARLWDMMNDAQAERLIETLEHEAWTDDEDVYDADSEFYDALDLADAEAIEFALEAEARHAW